VKAALDTSVVVRLLTGEPEDLALEAMRHVAERRRAGDRLLVSDLVLAETYYALQHHYGVPKTEVLATLRAFLATPEVETTGEAAEVLETPGLESAKPGFIDRVIHRGYLGAGGDELVTFERAARKLSGVRVLGA
jgi:predicted nucleic acid-binding protein